MLSHCFCSYGASYFVALCDVAVSECVVAFGADASQVCWVVSSACVEWDYVVDLCAGLAVADCADWLFS